ncbi:MAG: diguanylate cyclase [Candidatus Cloacimonetes bacterium]|nr:diguanylate cyclase [Candidatus Cloacimonadota bacterium]
MKPSHKSILIVEDQHIILTYIKSILKKKFGTIHTALNGAEGLNLYKTHKPDIVVTDLQMPVMDGLEMIQHIRTLDPDAKILITSAYSNTNYMLKAIDLGVNGFHIKPIDSDRLLEQIDALVKQLSLEEKALEEEEKFRVLSSAARDAIVMMDINGMVTFWNQGAERIFGYTKEEVIGKELHKFLAPDYYYEDHNKAMPKFRNSGDGKFVGKTIELKALRKDQSSIAVELSLTSVKLHNEWNAIGIMRDITDRILAKEELIKAYKKMDILAHTDHLTQLSNRLDMMEKLNYECTRFERSAVQFSIAIGDVDGFKEINDTYGHQAGDEVLSNIAHILQTSIRKQDIVGRWGGEEFILMFPKTTLEGALIVAEKIRKSIEEANFEYEQNKIRATITFGVATYDEKMDIDACIKMADEALYKGKKRGKNCVVGLSKKDKV